MVCNDIIFLTLVFSGLVNELILLGNICAASALVFKISFTTFFIHVEELTIGFNRAVLAGCLSNVENLLLVSLNRWYFYSCYAVYFWKGVNFNDGLCDNTANELLCLLNATPSFSSIIDIDAFNKVT